MMTNLRQKQIFKTFNLRKCDFLENVIELLPVFVFIKNVRARINSD